MHYIDNFLNSIPMYRLVLYITMLLSLFGIGFAFAGILPLNGVHMLISMVLIVTVCAVSNNFFGWLFKIPVNAESSYITGFIMFLIFAPVATVWQGAIVAIVAAAAMASKFAINYNGKHIANPAALAAVLAGLSGITAATWWIGSQALLPIVVIGGLLLARKLRRISMFTTFVIAAFISILAFNLQSIADAPGLITEVITSWPIIFFGAIMLTEPLTMPPRRYWQILYGAVVGLLIGIPFHIGPLYNAPEVSLLLGNIFAFIVSPKYRLALSLKHINQLAPQIYDFVFTSKQVIQSIPGQYMEWTLGHAADLRGNRRYFTIASSPTERDIHIGVKIPNESSSYKRALLAMQPGDVLYAGQLSGDFILPESGTANIVGIAGGIGITPFRSMAKYMSDTNQTGSLVLFYAAADPKEFVYTEVFEHNPNIKLIPVLSGSNEVPVGWTGKTGFITREMIEDEVPDYNNGLYYLSGPNVMVDAYKKLLVSMGIRRKQIITDYFPGY